MKRQMRVEEVKQVKQERSKWRSIVFASVGQVDSMFVYVLCALSKFYLFILYIRHHNRSTIVLVTFSLCWCLIIFKVFVIWVSFHAYIKGQSKLFAIIFKLLLLLPRTLSISEAVFLCHTASRLSVGASTNMEYRNTVNATSPKRRYYTGRAKHYKPFELYPTRNT